jgi:hypothetical protein
MVLVLFSAHCILQSVDRVLQVACSLVDLALSFQLPVAEDFTGRFLHGAPLACSAEPLIRSLSIAVSSLFVGL